jgi:predicted dehydrogenase
LKQLKVGIIGTGMAFERLHYPAYQELKEEYRIVALADPDLFKTKEWAGKLGIAAGEIYQDYREMLQNREIDVFDILVPIAQNFEVSKNVAAAITGTKKGMICEKPLAPDWADAKEYLELARRFQIPILIAENYRYNEDPNLIRELVRSGRIGSAYYFLWNRVTDFPAEMKGNEFAAREWRQHPEFPGGVFTDTAIHDIAALAHIFGAVAEVSAFAQTKKVTLGQYAVVNVNLRFQSGFTGQYTFFCGGQEAQRPLIGLRIFGDFGMIYQEERDCGVINLHFNDGRQEMLSYQPQRGYYNELLNFHKAMNGTEAIAVTPEIEFGDAAVIFAILTSIETRQLVALNQDQGYQPRYQEEDYKEKRPVM